MLQGRCISIEALPEKTIPGRTSLKILLQMGLETRAVEVWTASSVNIGDQVEITDAKEMRTLVPNTTGKPDLHWHSHVLDSRRLHALKIRNEVENGIERFFLNRGFLKVRTPLLVPSPGMEPHIRPISVQTGDPAKKLFIPTSPEFAMKKLLSGGLDKIFQICPCFRDEPFSSTHLSEFMMLEWYRAFAGYEDIMRDSEELVHFLATQITKSDFLTFENRKISVKPPWPRLKVYDLFQEYAGIDLKKCDSFVDFEAEYNRLHDEKSEASSWDELFFDVWLNKIENRLPEDQAVFVVDYPRQQAALSKLKQAPDGSLRAKRFEIFMGGMELANAFEELTDPVEQRERFIKDMDLREQLYGPLFPKNPIDEEFMLALTEGLPPSGGIALGVDRLIMLFADEPDIRKTVWLLPESPSYSKS